MSFMEPLLALQEVDVQIYELKKEAEDIPARKRQESERMEDAELALSAAQAELRAVQTRVADFELQVAAINEKVTKLRQQQMTLKTNKEFRAMEQEINHNLHDAEALEGEQIRAMDAVPIAEERVDAAQERHDIEKGNIESYLGSLDERLTEVEARLNELEEERVGMANKVPIPQLRHYERLRHKRFPTVVALVEGVCSGCHLQQTAATRHAVLRDDSIINCESCGRILTAG